MTYLAGLLELKGRGCKDCRPRGEGGAVISAAGRRSPVGRCPVLRASAGALALALGRGGAARGLPLPELGRSGGPEEPDCRTPAGQAEGWPEAGSGGALAWLPGANGGDGRRGTDWGARGEPRAQTEGVIPVFWASLLLGFFELGP